MATSWIVMQPLLDQYGDPIELLAQIARRGGDEHAHRRR
jgi:hypothetical protein